MWFPFHAAAMRAPVRAEYQAQQATALALAVESGDCGRVRALAEQAFYADKKFTPSWEHLKIALIREDKPMIRLLITWGARAPEPIRYEWTGPDPLSDLPPEKLANYARILRQCGADATFLEEEAKALGWRETPRELQVGDKMPDGSVYAGLTEDGKQRIYAMPADLDMTMTFNDAAKAVKKLNDEKLLGHGDWQIPSLENLRALYKNQNEGALRGTFKTAASGGSDFPGWYWSSTEIRDFSSFVHDVRFSVGNEGWGLKGNGRLSCRPVRLVELKGP